MSENNITIWVESYTEALYQWACYKVADADMAKDIVQETFITAYEKIDTYEGRSNPKTWLMAILNHKILDHYRKQLRSPVTSTLNNEPEFFNDEGRWQDKKRPKSWDFDANLLDDYAFLKTLENCMSKLPQQWCSAIRLKYLSEKDGNEVCKELSISATNYWQIIRRAKLNLRECLDFNWFKQ